MTTYGEHNEDYKRKNNRSKKSKICREKLGKPWKPCFDNRLLPMYWFRNICELLMSKWIVGIMFLVVIAMFWKGVEVLGPSNTNRDVLYQGPKTPTDERWKAAFEWQKKKRENADKSK